MDKLIFYPNEKQKTAWLEGIAALCRIFWGPDADLCQAILGAYAEKMRGVLSAGEIDLMYEAVRLIPFELGVRFLTDHLEGDRYFQVSRPGDNLAKARIQLDLVADIERKEPAIRAIVRERFADD